MADWLPLLALLAVLTAIAKPCGDYMSRVYNGERTWLHPVMRPVERCCYWLAGVREIREQSWTSYAASVLWFGFAGVLLSYVLFRVQGHLGLNPAGIPAMSPDLAFNTAVSFVTNTSWQSYSGETALSYLSQMTGIAVQSFLSVATSMAVAVAMFRGIAAQGSRSIGNFWVDMTRSVLYILLPLSIGGAVLLASQGVIQSFAPYVRGTTLEGATQMIAQGPVASQESIKMLSSDGGGFFNASGAHPYENPTPLSGFISLFLMLVLPAAFPHLFGSFVRDQRQGWALFTVMVLLFTLGFGVIRASERGNWEGKEVRFGIAGAALFAEASTATASGAVNSAHGSYRPLGVLAELANMHTGEVIFGGPGSGMYSMLLLVLLTVFVAGLMVGRTPEYLGQKIERYEVKMVTLAMLLTSAALLLLAATTVTSRATAGFTQQGMRGLSEALYAFTSAVANNGSSMAGVSSNTAWYNLTLGLGMLAGRYFTIIPVLAIAGSLAAKKRYTMDGAMPTHNAVFVLLLVFMIVLITAITYLPVCFLGPLAEMFT